MRGFGAASLALLLVGTVAAQEKRLSDVASDIQLRPPSEEAVFVDLASAGVGASSTRDLVELADEYSESLATVAGLLSEAGDDDRFFAVDWREQIATACLDVDTLGSSLAVMRPPERLASAHEELIDASRDCDRATRGVREALRMDQPLYGSAMRLLSDCREVVSRSVETMHRIRRDELQELQPAYDDPLAAAVAIADLCRERAGGQGPRFDECVAGQEGARRAIADRFGFSVMLDDATFNVIRNSCRLEWPGDYVGRNRCELQRIAQSK